MSAKLPKQFQRLSQEFPGVISALEALGKAAADGPLPDKIIELVRLGAAAAMRSEGSAHSHARRAVAAGATPAEVRHALIALTSTIGFPQASAALAWVGDLPGAKPAAAKAKAPARKAAPQAAAKAKPAAKKAPAAKKPAKPKGK
jgi:alkylhydroperoxidase/carboxymuconolactone decarboxylase family protein YurZ